MIHSCINRSVLALRHLQVYPVAPMQHHTFAEIANVAQALVCKALTMMYSVMLAMASR